MDTQPADSAPPALMGLVDALAECVPQMLTDVRKGLYELEPSYAEYLDDNGEEMVSAAQAAVAVMLAQAEQVRTNGPQALESGLGFGDGMFQEIGRLQWRLGIPIGTLLSAYQLGARVAWRHMSEVTLRNGAPPDALAAMAEAVFCFVDQLSSASTAGYLDEQTKAAADRERSRDELVDLLLSGRADAQALHAAGRRAGWQVPKNAAIVLIDPSNESGRSVASRLDPNWLSVRWAGLHGFIVPMPGTPGIRARLRHGLQGTGAVVGPDVPLEGLAGSARFAELAAVLQQSGVLAEDPVFVDEHLDAIIVHRDARLLDALRRRVLQPLDGAAAGSRDALLDTLRAWFRHLGDRRAVAAELQVHPQTVRYRMERLHELFGPALDDPAERLKIMLATVWDR